MLKGSAVTWLSYFLLFKLIPYFFILKIGNEFPILAEELAERILLLP